MLLLLNVVARPLLPFFSLSLIVTQRIHVPTVLATTTTRLPYKAGNLVSITQHFGDSFVLIDEAVLLLLDEKRA